MVQQGCNCQYHLSEEYDKAVLCHIWQRQSNIHHTPRSIYTSRHVVQDAQTGSSCVLSIRHKIWYVCLILWTPNYCRHPSSFYFRCCPTWFCNVMQCVLYPHTCSTPCLSNNFCWKYWSCHCSFLVQTNCLLVKLLHAQHSWYDSPNNGEFLVGLWDICSPQLCGSHSY